MAACSQNRSETSITEASTAKACWKTVSAVCLYVCEAKRAEGRCYGVHFFIYSSVCGLTLCIWLQKLVFVHSQDTSFLFLFFRHFPHLISLYKPNQNISITSFYIWLQHKTNLNLLPNKNGCCTKLACVSTSFCFIFTFESILLPNSAYRTFKYFCVRVLFLFSFWKPWTAIWTCYANHQNRCTDLLSLQRCSCLLYTSWCSRMLTWRSVVSHWHDSCCVARDWWRVTVLSAVKTETSESHTFITPETKTDHSCKQQLYRTSRACPKA